MIEENKRILGIIRDDPKGVEALAFAVSHVNHNYNGTGSEVHWAVVKHIKRDYQGCPHNYLNEIKTNPHLPLYSHSRKILGLLD